MLNLQLPTFAQTRKALTEEIRKSPPVRTERWQGKDVSKDPAATTYELRNVCFEVPLDGVEDLQHWRSDTAANVPWADDHFLERVGGEPLNPGVQWANWPWAPSANKFRNGDGDDDDTLIFNHTYMERLWPRWARKTPGGKLPVSVKGPGQPRKLPDRRNWFEPNKGIAHTYGDLQDLVELLAREPFTRQAYIPLFFPEDTGYGDGGRKVCTLGYQFLVRPDEEGVNRLHVWYPLRSCDLIRHFPDDCYLAIRLMLWVLDQCRLRDGKFWNGVLPGTYAMHMTSLHIFENDRRVLVSGEKQ